MKPECPPTRQDETKWLLQCGHQRAETTHSPSQSKATKTIHKSPDGAKTKQKNTEDHQGQPESVIRPTQAEKTEEPQEQKSHEEILSVHMDDTQKSTYTSKVGSTEVTALFDSGTTLSCISKWFYDCISHVEPSKVINTNARPAITVTSASDDELIYLWRCRLCVKLDEKMFEYYFQILKNLKEDLILGLNFQRTFKILQDITDDNNLYLHIRRKIVTFSQQAKNTTNHISTHGCMQIKPQRFKQFQVKAPKGLKKQSCLQNRLQHQGNTRERNPCTRYIYCGKMPKVHWNNSHKSVRWSKKDSTRPAHQHSTSHRRQNTIQRRSAGNHPWAKSRSAGSQRAEQWKYRWFHHQQWPSPDEKTSTAQGKAEAVTWNEEEIRQYNRWIFGHF